MARKFSRLFYRLSKRCQTGTMPPMGYETYKLADFEKEAADLKGLDSKELKHNQHKLEGRKVSLEVYSRTFQREMGRFQRLKEPVVEEAMLYFFNVTTDLIKLYAERLAELAPPDTAPEKAK